MQQQLLTDALKIIIHIEPVMWFRQRCIRVCSGSRRIYHNVIGVKKLFPGKSGGTFNHEFQFPNIPRPIVAPQAPIPEDVGPISYVDGHMIAFWSRVCMHKGKITMPGRTMPGSRAVITHSEAGQALWVEYYPPALPLSQVIAAYCQQVWMATGIALFVIDRAVNSVAMACAFTCQGRGLLSMLDENEHHGLSSFDTTVLGTDEEGNTVYKGTWKEPREEDPRCFVPVESVESRVRVYRGTPHLEQSVEPIRWPGLYRQRSEIQENRFKRMIEHGALNTNYGRKKQVGPDRHQQRAQPIRVQIREAPT